MLVSLEADNLCSGLTDPQPWERACRGSPTPDPARREGVGLELQRRFGDLELVLD